MTYKSASTKPTKSGVYPTRVAIVNHLDGDPISQGEGFSFWDNPRQRWGAQRPTRAAALAEKWTAGYRYNVAQDKEWKDER